MNKMMCLMNFTFLLSLISCKTTDSEVKVHMDGMADSTMMLLYNTESMTTDTGYICDNELTFYVNCTEPTRLSLHTDYKKRSDFESIYLWKEHLKKKEASHE